MRNSWKSSLLPQGACALKWVRKTLRDCVYRASLVLSPGGKQSGWAQYLMPRMDGLIVARAARQVGDLH